jgi:low affinity Fe/Cu permease
MISHDKHGLKLRLHKTRDGLSADPDRLSVFQRAADTVSAAMGRPANIMVWLILVVGWTLIFAFHLVSANATFLPSWFTGTAFNFPLNLLTTVAELFIGFLVGAAANRSERNLELTLGRIEQVETGIGGVLGAVKTLVENTAGVVASIRDLVSKTHDMQTQQMTLLAGLEHANAELAALRATVSRLPQDTAATVTAAVAEQVTTAAGTAPGPAARAPRKAPPQTGGPAS